MIFKNVRAVNSLLRMFRYTVAPKAVMTMAPDFVGHAYDTCPEKWL